MNAMKQLASYYPALTPLSVATAFFRGGINISGSRRVLELLHVLVEHLMNVVTSVLTLRPQRTVLFDERFDVSHDHVTPSLEGSQKVPNP